MATEVKLPQMGESIAEGTVTTWLKKVGDKVNRDEPLFEISTDKVDAEIPSPVSGVLLEILVTPGKTVPINTVVAIIGEAGESTAPTPTTPTPAAAPAPTRASTLAPAPAAPATPSTAKSTLSPSPAAPAAAAALRTTKKSSPLVRNIAASHNIDIGQISGTGQNGRVTKEDILAVVEQGGGAVTAARTSAAPPPGATVAATPTVVPAAYRPRVQDGDRVEELSTMRAKIAEHMTASRHISAHVQTLWEIDYSNIAALRAKHKAAWAEQHGVPLTYTAFLMKAAVVALEAFPVVNASLDGSKAIYHRDINLGVAVALDWGLIVPVVANAGELNLLGLARHAADLAERARTKKLKPEEVQAGTFTISNPGVFGSVIGFPIINQPQVAIMGVGAVEKRAVVINDMIAIRPRGYLSLSFDHRLVDGAVADQFMAKIKKTLEEFAEADM
ncbi:MAG: 2-oxo acid dehydrogenase subunit E2 [Deltaproteobacteria bacterium]|nr:2-oxo acid dehydrogenase subunit E2 [Deltaproteobacteria bacterium]